MNGDERDCCSTVVCNCPLEMYVVHCMSSPVSHSNAFLSSTGFWLYVMIHVFVMSSVGAALPCNQFCCTFPSIVSVAALFRNPLYILYSLDCFVDGEVCIIYSLYWLKCSRKHSSSSPCTKPFLVHNAPQHSPLYPLMPSMFRSRLCLTCPHTLCRGKIFLLPVVIFCLAYVLMWNTACLAYCFFF